jgi:multidrug efflux pump subunit AcrA (membrane-fusion protein)
MNGRWTLGLAGAVGIGFAAGWWLAPDPAPPDEAPHEHDAGDEVTLPAEALASLGVEVAPLEAAAWTESIALPGTIRLPPGAEQPVPAPLGGRVERIDAKLGQTVAPGDALVTIVREPLPLPELRVTGEVVRPAQEELHRMVAELRRAHAELQIARAELERVAAAVGPATEPPILPRQLLLERQYELQRAERALDFARHELLRHGVESEQVDAIAAGGEPPAFDRARWRSALERSGLFGPEVQALHGALPASLRELPIAAAAAAELVASGLAGRELTEWLAEDAAAGADFLAIATLLQRGHSLADLRRLRALGALAPVFTVRAPAGGDAETSFDLDAIHVAPLAQVAAGTPLVTLLDARRLLLEVHAAGGEAAALIAAWQLGAPIRATPAVPGAGPELHDLRLDRVRAGDDTPAAGFLELTNEPLPPAPDAARSWALRAGMHYRVELPQRVHERVAVLPPDAIARDGATPVLFRRRGEAFAPVPVELLHSGPRGAVVALRDGGALAAGDAVVRRGAFALLLALRGRATAGQHHHGH